MVEPLPTLQSQGGSHNIMVAQEIAPRAALNDPGGWLSLQLLPPFAQACEGTQLKLRGTKFFGGYVHKVFLRSQ